MTQWQPPKREPKQTKAELYEMLADAVCNTQAENKRPQQQAKKVKKGMPRALLNFVKRSLR